MDATTLGQRFTVLAISVVYRGCAIPVAWKVVGAHETGRWRPHWEALFTQLRGHVPAGWAVLVCADRGLYARWLYRHIVSVGWHPFLRINRGGLFRVPGRVWWRPLLSVVPLPGHGWRGQVICFKGQPLECTLVARSRCAPQRSLAHPHRPRPRASRGLLVLVTRLDWVRVQRHKKWGVALGPHQDD